MKSYHDYNIYRYENHCEEQTIRLYLRKHYGEDHATLMFLGVVGHLLEHALAGNIVLDLGEVDSAYFYNREKEGLNSYQKYGLHLDTSSLDHFLSGLAEKNLTCYELTTSYGLSGWIIAREVVENE